MARRCHQLKFTIMRSPYRPIRLMTRHLVIRNSQRKQMIQKRMKKNRKVRMEMRKRRKVKMTMINQKKANGFRKKKLLMKKPRKKRSTPQK